MTTETQDWSIENVGGIEKIEFTLHQGVNVLRGRNAAGKTSAMRAIVRAQGGGGELERRDGATRGSVSGPGVQLTVGKVVRTTGEAELSLADVSPLAQLIDPGLKDTEAAARARIRALADLLQISPDDQAVKILCQGDRDLEEWLTRLVAEEPIEDLLAASEKLRFQSHALARSCEEMAEQHEGKQQAADDQAAEAMQRLGGDSRLLVDITPEDAEQDLISGAKSFERETARCEGREKLEAEQAELRGALGEEPNPEARLAATKEIQGELAQQEEAIAELEEQLAAYRVARGKIMERLEASQGIYRSLVEAARKWHAAQEILARTAEGPTREELADLERRLVIEPQQNLAMARSSADYRIAVANAASAKETVRSAKLNAQGLRDLAKEIPTALAKILAEAGVEGLTVVGGRIHALVDGTPMDWEKRLSDGQRIRIALDVAARRYEGVVPIHDEFWMRLDPTQKKAFAKIAKEKALFVLTEEPSNGALRVEQPRS